MKRLEGYEVYQDDTLVIRWKRKRLPRNLNDEYIYSQGKRLSKEKLNLYPWVHEMARIYVKDGAAAAVGFIRRQVKGCGLQEAYDKLCAIRKR